MPYLIVHSAQTMRMWLWKLQFHHCILYPMATATELLSAMPAKSNLTRKKYESQPLESTFHLHQHLHFQFRLLFVQVTVAFSIAVQVRHAAPQLEEENQPRNSARFIQYLQIVYTCPSIFNKS